MTIENQPGVRGFLVFKNVLRPGPIQFGPNFEPRQISAPSIFENVLDEDRDGDEDVRGRRRPEEAWS